MDRTTPILEFIKREILHGSRKELKVDEDLLGTGVIDSLGILKLVSFIEERFGIQVPDSDVVYEHFNSVQAIAAYLDRH